MHDQRIWGVILGRFGRGGGGSGFEGLQSVIRKMRKNCEIMMADLSNGKRS